MKIHAKNGAYLGEIIYGEGVYKLNPRSNMTEFMLEEAHRILKELNKVLK